MTKARKHHLPWTSDEDRWLAANYRSMEAARLATQLGRSRRSVLTRAHELGLSHSNQNPAQHPTLTPAQEEELRRVYQEGPKKGEIKRLTHKWGVAPNTIRRWARNRGLVKPTGDPNKKGRAWSDEEDRILEETAHLSPEAVSARLARRDYHRSPAAIAYRRWQTAISAEDGGYHSLHQAAELLGVSDKTLSKAVETGELKVERRGEREGHKGCAVMYVHRRKLRLWVRDNPFQIDPRRVDLVWLIDLLAEG